MSLKCARCGKKLTGRQKKWCSVNCRNQGNKKTVNSDLKKLIEVSVLSQRTNLALAKSVKDLTIKVDDMVSMFETAAKGVGDLREVSKNEVEQIAKELKEVMQQNKGLAEGLIALDNYVRKHKNG
jgi:hypothetical protein